MPDRTDTVEYTADELAEARRVVEQMAAEAHRCEPRWWPHKLGETWTCDCGHRYVCDTADHMGPLAAQAIALGLLDPLTLGWRSV